jgi:hypothetical protein
LIDRADDLINDKIKKYFLVWDSSKQKTKELIQAYLSEEKQV